MFAKRPYLIAAILVAATAFVVMQNVTRRPETLLRNSSEMAEFAPFDSEIAQIEAAWDAPIPDDLWLIGGPDEIGYARVWKDVDDPATLFNGTFLNARVRYTGPLTYEHPQGHTVPDLTQDGYVLANIDGTRLIVGQENAVPRDWFYLVPTAPALIERATPP